MNMPKTIMSEIEFAALGGESLAYIRTVPDDEAEVLAREIGVPVSGIQLFSVHGADGRRLAIADSFATAAASASEHDLETVRVH
jgi:hypothetical protein